MPFDRALALQQEIREAVLEGAPERLLLVEHPPAITVGRRGSRDDLRWGADELTREGIGVFDTPRGGQLTLHLPGQLVVYPVVMVGRRVRGHLEDLAEVSLAVVEELGVQGARYRSEHPGLWVGERKLASIGVHISRGVAIQGLSLNLDVDRALFASLVSCGLPQVEMTSVRELAGASPAVDAVGRRWAEVYAQRAARTLTWAQL